MGELRQTASTAKLAGMQRTSKNGSRRTLEAVFFFCGTAVTITGPLLPLLGSRWKLTDEQAGLIVSAGFAGSFIGSVGIILNRRLSLLLSTLSIVGGLCAFAWQMGQPEPPPMWAPPLVLAVLGAGLGQLMTVIQIMTGEAAGEKRASALAWLNGLWSLGASVSVFAGSVALTVPSISQRLVLLGAMFLPMLGVALGPAGCGGESRKKAKTRAEGGSAQSVLTSRPVRPAENTDGELGPGASSSGKAGLLWGMLWFPAVLFFYGVTETGLASWIAAYVDRYSLGRLALSQLATGLLWAGMSVSRILFSRVKLSSKAESRVLKLAVGLLLVAVTLLLRLPVRWVVMAMATLIGVCAGPLYPLVLARLMKRTPGPRFVGLTLAACGVGATLAPGLIGAVSTGTHSLRIAMLVPACSGLLLLLALSSIRAKEEV